MAYVLLLIALWVMTFPNVRAQTTSITNLQSPTNASTRNLVTVTVAVTYDRASSGDYLGVLIVDETDVAPATGTAISSKNTCIINSGLFINSAMCFVVLTSTSGSDIIRFNLRFSSVKTYKFDAYVVLQDSSAKTISGSESHREFSINVMS